MKLELYLPVKPRHVNQIFGVDPVTYAKYGLKGHNGIDLQAYHGQPVYAAHDGVCYPEVDNSGGNGVVIRTNQAYDYEGGLAYFKTIYWHLVKADAVVKTGQQVKAGDLIGYADSTGFSTGDHLHFGLKPQAWYEDNWSWQNVDQDNGYLGAIDPTPYLNGFFAEDIKLVVTVEKGIEVATKAAATPQLWGPVQKLLDALSSLLKQIKWPL